MSICQVCIMDDSDPAIEFFGEQGCNHCLRAKERLASELFHGEMGAQKLAHLMNKIKAAGRGKPYDCVIGISGGVDSSHVLVKARELGLRPLAVHIDTGWNSELAVHNIRELMNRLGIDLVSNVIDWNEIRALQRACLNVPLVDIEIVSDHTIFATLYRLAAKHDIGYILAGMNLATESIMPRAWAYDKRDAKHLMRVYERFGEGLKLRSYPFLFPLRFLYYIFVKRIRVISLLNYVDYDKASALEDLSAHYGYRPYANKHGESVFTRFYQEYYLPQKFGFDKRRAHYSSQIAAGQLSRNEALALMQKPLFAAGEAELERAYVLKKLGFSDEQFEAIMRKPAIAHSALPTNAWMFDLKNPVTRFVRRIARGGS